MLHKVIAFFLTLVLFTSIISSVSILVDFKINQTIIAKTLCVQKDDQQGCNGKCQLVKALKKDLQTNNETSLPNIKNSALNIYYLEQKNESEFSFFYIINSNRIFDGLKQNSILRHYKIPTPPPKV